MQLDPAHQQPATLRTLSTLNDNFKKFEADGSRLPPAKYPNNVIRHALLPLSLDGLCIPALHFDLRIYIMWMFQAFTADIRQLDIKLAASLGKAGAATTDSPEVAQAAQLSSDTEGTTTERQQILNQVNFFQAQVSVKIHLKDMPNLRESKPNI